MKDDKSMDQVLDTHENEFAIEQKNNAIHEERSNEYKSMSVYVFTHPMLLNICVFLLFIMFAFVSNWSILLGENLMKWDIWDAEYPAQVLMTDALDQHTIPLWNPLMQYGTPYYSILGMPVWYPVTLILAMIGYTPITVAVSYAIHVVIGGFGMFLLAGLEFREKGKSFSSVDLCASIAVGLLYCGCGVFLSNAQHIMVIISAAWIPYVFYFTRRYLQEKHVFFAMSAGLCAGLILLGGYPEMFYDMFLFLVPYTLFLNYKKEKKICANIVSAAGRYILICLFTVLAGSIILIPFLHNMGLITRGNGIGQVANGYSVTGFLSAIFSQMSKILSGYEPSMINYYAGVITILMIPAIFKSKQIYKKLYSVLMAAAVMLCWGGNSFIHTLLYRFLPMYDSFRFPTLNRVFIVLFALLMTAYALHDILEQQEVPGIQLRYTGVLLMICSSLGVLSALIGNLLTENANLSSSKCIIFSESAFKASWVLLLYFIMMYALYHKKINGKMVKTFLLSAVCVELLTYSLAETPISITRYNPTDYSNDWEVRNTVDGEFQENAERIRDTNFAGHVRSSSGLDSQKIVFQKTFDEEGYLSFLLSKTEEFKHTYRRSTMEQNPVVYFTNNVVTSEDISYEEWANKCSVPVEQIYVDQGFQNQKDLLPSFEPEISKKSQLLYTPVDNGVDLQGWLGAGESRTGRVRLYFSGSLPDTVKLQLTFVENENTALYYEDTFVLKDCEAGRYTDIFFPAVNKTYQSLQIRSQDVLPDSAELVFVERMTEDKYTDVDWFGFNSIQMTVEAPTEGYVTILQAMHDGWTVYVDGQKQEIDEINRCFMGILLEKGNHTIVLKFRPKDFFFGAGITALFGICFVIEFFIWKRYKKNLTAR